MTITKNKLYFHYYKDKVKTLLKNPAQLPFYIDRFRKYSNSVSYDVLIVSYPKSGRTWLQNILVEIGRIKTENVLEDDTPISDALSLLPDSEYNFPSILATHDKSSWEQVEPLHDEDEIKKEDFSSFKNNKVIFLYRDPRDVLVSQFYHLIFRNKIKGISKDDLIDNKIFGLKKIINFMNKWKKHSERNNQGVLCMSYEEMKNNSTNAIMKMAHFIDLDVNESEVEEALQNSNIRRMQKKQSSKENKDPWTKTNDVKNKNSYQTRKGIVGEHAEFFDEKQLARINQTMKEQLDPSFDYKVD